MSENKPHIIEIGTGGRIRLPKEVMEALDAGPGNQIKFEIFEGHVHIARHKSKDPFADAANKKTPGLQELMEKEATRKKEAAELFNKRVQEKHEIKPEDREDFWR